MQSKDVSQIQDAMNNDPYIKTKIRAVLIQEGYINKVTDKGKQLSDFQVMEKVSKLNDKNIQELVSFINKRKQKTTLKQPKIESSNLGTLAMEFGGGSGQAQALEESKLSIPNPKLNITQQTQETQRLDLSSKQIQRQLNQSFDQQKSDISKQLLADMINDSKLSKKIPELARIKKNLSKGSIDQKEADNQSAQIIMSSVQSSGITKSIVVDIIERSVKQKNSSQKSATDIVNTIDASNIQLSDQNNSIQGRTTEIPKPLVQPVIIQSVVQDNSMQNMALNLQIIAKKHPGSASSIQAQQMIRSLHKSQASAEEAKDRIEQSYISKSQNPSSQQIVTGVIQNPKEEQKVQTLSDVLSNRDYISAVENRISKLEMTEDQQSLAERTLFDIDALSAILMEQYDDNMMMSDMDSSDLKSQKNQKLDDTGKIQVGNHSLTIQQIQKIADNVLDKISKIAGDISTIAKYSEFKNQTEVFATKIIKKEPTTFTIKSGSAFRLRQCC